VNFGNFDADSIGNPAYWDIILAMNSKFIRDFSFGLLIIGYVYYIYRYILATSFLIGGSAYYVLFDDAMISMRYAYNLAHGLGPVWNVGERVEGFTNPLWVGIMALVHLLPIRLNQTSLYIQVLGASFLTLNLFLVKKIVEHFTDDLFAMLAAVALTAFYAPLNSYGLLGMEVSLLVLILTAVIWLILKNDKQFNIWVYILLAISTLVRFDMAVPYIVILSALLFIQKEHRKQHLIWGLGLLILFLGGQTLARYLYYGALLPNTYYLKVEGWLYKLRILRGIYALIQFVYYSNWALILLPFTLLLFRREWKVTLLMLVLLGQVAYSVYVGGDAWENHGGANRYIVIAMPIFFVMFSWSAIELLKKAANQLITNNTKEFERKILHIGWRIVFVAAFAFSILNFNALIGEWKSIERWNLTRRPDYVAGSDRNLQVALAIENVTKPGASVAVVGAGTIPYLLPDRYAIDILGKADPYIAHQTVRTPMSIPDVPNMRPGHMKWDYAYTFGKLKPDVIVSIWEGTGAEAALYLEKSYVSAVIGEKIIVYLLKDSPNILWDKVVIK
jgi:arabinofuranosyltransferase